MKIILKLSWKLFSMHSYFFLTQKTSIVQFFFLHFQSIKLWKFYYININYYYDGIIIKLSVRAEKFYLGSRIMFKIMIANILAILIFVDIVFFLNVMYLFTKETTVSVKNIIKMKHKTNDEWWKVHYNYNQAVIMKKMWKYYLIALIRLHKLLNVKFKE